MGLKYIEAIPTTHPNMPLVVRIRHGDGTPVCELRGGLAHLISTNFANLERLGGDRSDDYLDGVVDALIHVAMTGEVPVILGPL